MITIKLYIRPLSLVHYKALLVHFSCSTPYSISSQIILFHLKSIFCGDLFIYLVGNRVISQIMYSQPKRTPFRVIQELCISHQGLDDLVMVYLCCSANIIPYESLMRTVKEL